MKNYDPRRAARNYKRAMKRGSWSRPGRGRPSTPKHWKNWLVPELAKAVLAEKPEWDRFETSGPCGICSRMIITFHKGDEEVFWLMVNDPDLETGELHVTDYGVDTGEYAKGTIGEVNGMNHPRILIDPAWPVEKLLSYGHVPEKAERAAV